MAKRKYELESLIDWLKNIGIIAGSLGSLAALFFWIGNAIIIARLRAYNMYGIVHYTDEYVEEAGYQFIHDIFTFFSRWDLILLFIIATIIVVTLIPIGPFVRGEKKDLSKKPVSIRILVSILENVRNKGIHYFLFLVLVLSTSLSLTSKWGVKRLSENIINQERILSSISEGMEGKLLAFTPLPKSETSGANEFQVRFYNLLRYDEEPTQKWLCRSLSKLYGQSNVVSGDKLNCDAMEEKDQRKLGQVLKRFQKDFEIQEKSDFAFDGDFKESKTFQKLLEINLNRKLNEKLHTRIASTLRDIKELLSASLSDEEDFSSLVVVPANYEVVNNSIHKTRTLRENILAFFEPKIEKNEKSLSKDVMSALFDIKPIHFGSILLSYSFWVLMGALVYLLLNTPRILNFKNWEKGYFCLILFLFLTIVVTLPTAYGRYKFEFKIQRLNDIIFAGNDMNNPIKKKLNAFWDQGARLYILGPTKGREIIVGVLTSDPYSKASRPQIIMLDRDTYKYINVEPVKREEIPEIIKILQEKERG